MKKSFRILSVLLSVVMLGAIMVGCTDDDAKKAAANSAEAKAKIEKVDLTGLTAIKGLLNISMTMGDNPIVMKGYLNYQISPTIVYGMCNLYTDIKGTKTVYLDAEAWAIKGDTDCTVAYRAFCTLLGLDIKQKITMPLETFGTADLGSVGVVGEITDTTKIQKFSYSTDAGVDKITIVTNSIEASGEATSPDYIPAIPSMSFELNVEGNKLISISIAKVSISGATVEGKLTCEYVAQTITAPDLTGYEDITPVTPAPPVPVPPASL